MDHQGSPPCHLYNNGSDCLLGLSLFNRKAERFSFCPRSHHSKRQNRCSWNAKQPQAHSKTVASLRMSLGLVRGSERGGDSFNVTQLASKYIIHYHALCILSKIILEDLLYIQQVFSKSLPATALDSEDSTVNTTDDNPWLCLYSGRERVNKCKK